MRSGDFFGGLGQVVERSMTSLFGSSNARYLKKLQPTVAAIGELEPKYQAMTDAELKEQTAQFRKRLAGGETLDDLLVEAFAVCREAGRRALGMRHFDVQLMGGIVLHRGSIAEMVTGEGKTLVATLPAYLNALEGSGVHVVTVNDYLARRDMEWMGPLYLSLGLTVGTIQSQMDAAERQLAYECDITYGTNNEFGFDYLRDNMRPAAKGDDRYDRTYQQVQGPLHYAVIDEVDNILIDEARTPLIISGPAHDDVTRYVKADRIARQLRKAAHFEVNEKEHTAHLTDDGVRAAEQLAGVESFYTAGQHGVAAPDRQRPEGPPPLQARRELRGQRRGRGGDRRRVHRPADARPQLERRPAPGRRGQGGRDRQGRVPDPGHDHPAELLQAVRQDLRHDRHGHDRGRRVLEDLQAGRDRHPHQPAAAPHQQCRRDLPQRAGEVRGHRRGNRADAQVGHAVDRPRRAAPGQASSARATRRSSSRTRRSRQTESIPRGKIGEIERAGRPILVGTVSIERSELISQMLEQRGIPHQVLNAKHHQREAEIVAQAGRKGAVTIATNMAGRGTDIILGGNPEAMAWAKLQEKYPTRLDVPPEEWDALVHEIEVREQMKAEGREVAAMGGLHILGSERHEARRIDLQLRGRCGRQGDPGSSRFYLSLEDDLMRIFAGEWVKNVLTRLGMKEGEAIESRMVSRRIEGAQKKVEERNFEVRKNLLEYDEVMDEQRKRVYGYRQRILEGANCKQLILDMIRQQIARHLDQFLDGDYGTETFAKWAGKELSAEFDARDFRGMDFADAERYALDHAERKAEGQVLDALEENLPEDVEDRRDWNWEALAKFANTRWRTNLRDRELKQIGREEIGEFLIEKAGEALRKVDLSPGRPFLEADYGLRAACAGLKHKFGIELHARRSPRTAAGRIPAGGLPAGRGRLSRKGDRVPGHGRPVALHHPRHGRPQALRPRGTGRVGPATVPRGPGPGRP